MPVTRSGAASLLFRRRRLLLVATLALAACGTTTTLRTSADVADAGQTYAKAMQAVADLTIEKHIDWEANGLVKSREPSGISAAQLGADLDIEVKGSRAFVHQVILFKAHAQRLGDYFASLGQLVKADVKQAYVDSTKQLAGSVGALGKELEAAGIAKGIHVSDAQATAVGALAGSVATAVHGEIVAGVLRRDAALIDAEIGLQGDALEFFRKKIGFTDRLDVDRNYIANVRTPYAQGPAPGTGRPELPADWRDNLAFAIRDVQIEAQLADAQSASAALQNAWRAYLAGNGNASDLLADVTLLRDTAEAGQALHANRH